MASTRIDRSVISCPGCGVRNRVPVSASGVPRCASCKQSLPWLVDADEAGFAAATTATVPVLVDLWAAWCGPCRTMAPLLERAAAQRAGRLKVVKVDIDVAPGVARRFAVQAVPTLLLLSGGHEVSRQVGAVGEAALDRWLDSALVS
jgi:thioredoxin 2